MCVFILSVPSCVGRLRSSPPRFVATNHRVTHCKKERLSVPFFLEPVHSMPIPAPGEGPLTEGSLAASEHTGTYLDYIQQSNARFKEYAGNSA